MVLIGILATKGSGKDTVADHIVRNHLFNKMSFADPIKKITQILFGFDNEQLYGDKKETIDTNWNVTPRTVFQYLGTDIFRNDINKIIPGINNDFWINSFKVKYKNIINDDANTCKNIVIADVRFQNEVDAIHDLGGMVIKLSRPSLDQSMVNETHESELGVGNITNHDHVIINDGTLTDLYDKMDHCINFYI
jgi:hypothetical protein